MKSKKSGEARGTSEADDGEIMLRFYERWVLRDEKRRGRIF